MPYEMTWEPRGVYKRFHGVVPFQEYMRSQERVLADPRADDIRYVINDLIEVDSYSVTDDQAEYAAAITRGASISNPRLQIAYVTTDSRVLMLIKAASIISSYALHAFPTRVEARKWAAGVA